MSWRKVLALGGVASVIAIGCTVTVSDHIPDGGEPIGETGGSGNGGSGNKDAGTGGTKATGGSAGKATGGSSGSSTGGKGGAGGASGASSTGGKGGSGGATVCMPDKDAPCDYCIETKCCDEWLDCVNDDDCMKEVNGQQEEYLCVQDCLLSSDGGYMTLEECAGKCKHDPVGVSAATNALLSCMVATGTGDASGSQNCSNECFGREP